MQTELLITDVTQMREGRVCVAGVTHKNEAVRLLLRSGDMLMHHLQLGDESIIRPRAVLAVDVERKEKLRAPHVEDHYWVKPTTCGLLRVVDEGTWRAALRRTLSPTLEQAYGAPLQKKRKVAPDCGERSIGTIRPTRVTKVRVAPDAYGEKDECTVRLDFMDGDDTWAYNIPVTDMTLIRYVQSLLQSGSGMEEIGHDLSGRLRRSEIYLRVGLTRPYRRPDEHESWSYVQINGIHSFPDYLEGEDLQTLWSSKSAKQRFTIQENVRRADDLPF